MNGPVTATGASFERGGERMSIYLSRGILLYCGVLACVLGAVFGIVFM